MPYGTPRTEAERQARHRQLYGSKSNPPARRLGWNDYSSLLNIKDLANLIGLIAVVKVQDEKLVQTTKDNKIKKIFEKEIEEYNLLQKKLKSLMKVV